MGKYFGRQPRYSQEEAEAQAKQAIEAAVSKGRPPEEDWKPLAPRLAEINQELATRPRPDVDLGPPPRRAGWGEAARPAARRPVNQILRPREPEPPAPAAAPSTRAARASAPAEAPAPPPAQRAASPAKRATRAPAPAAPSTKRAPRAASSAAPAKRTTAKKKRSD